MKEYMELKWKSQGSYSSITEHSELASNFSFEDLLTHYSKNGWNPIWNTYQVWSTENKEHNSSHNTVAIGGRNLFKENLVEKNILHKSVILEREIKK